MREGDWAALDAVVTRTAGTSCAVRIDGYSLAHVVVPADSLVHTGKLKVGGKCRLWGTITRIDEEQESITLDVGALAPVTIDPMWIVETTPLERE